MATLDLKRQLRNLYTAPSDMVTCVHVPPMSFLMIDGHGDLNTTPAYKAAVEALYGLAYALKFRLKKDGLDYTVMPLEGLWWADDMRQFSVDRKADWNWTMMIAQPPEATPELFTDVLEEFKRKKASMARAPVRLECYEEGCAAQVMHIGPYAAEAPTIERLHAYIDTHGWHRRGRHHEIYLGDPNRSSPEKLRTILRQPIAE